MEYKDTLNLPKTGFPMRADLVKREPRRLERWERLGVNDKALHKNAGAEKFILHDGPPFANGDVHIGTALNKILKDFIVKFQSLRGRHAPYVPGWDCHGLPIEFKVTQRLREEGRTDADAATIRSECETYARGFIDRQRDQFRRLGVFGAWDDPYLTLDRKYEADELRLFADIVAKGFVYRGKKPVYWSIPARTALAEAEVEYKDHRSQSIYFKLPLVDHPGTSLLVWTTTPWTVPANLGVAFNSSFSYSMVRVGEEAFILSTLLVDKAAEICGWDDFEILRSLHGEDVANLTYKHPFCDRQGQLYPGDHFVENTTGTGFVHIAPGHGLEDYGVGLANGLPIYSPVDDSGALAHTDDLPVDQQMPESMVGAQILPKKGRSEANEVVIEALKAANALAHQENYDHSYPHCWRSKTPVIFRAMDQWFIGIDHEGFREKALQAIDDVTWAPDWGKNRIVGAVSARPDWCISRQRSWGVPIPVFYCEDGEAVLDPVVIRNTADWIEEAGSNVWFDQSTEALWARVCPEGWEGPTPTRKGEDTLDVWIDSGSSSRSVLAARDILCRDGAAGLEGWQADMYLEGSDQHRGWFQSSLLLSLAANEAPPYRTVLTHGFMVDADREKISKSKQGEGGYQKPQTADAYVGDYGADVVRLWVASQDFRNDIVVSADRIKTVGEAYRGIRNALRYQLSNLYDFDPKKDAVPFEQMGPLDRWILARYSELETEVLAAYESAEFHLVYQSVTRFVSVELSAVYHDLVKDRLYCDAPGSDRRRSTQSALHLLVGRFARLLSPILVFTTDEAWEFLPNAAEDACIHLETLESRAFALDDFEEADWKTLFGWREPALSSLEGARRDKTIGKALEAVVIMRVETAELPDAQRLAGQLAEILNVSSVLVTDEAEVALSGGTVVFETDERVQTVHASVAGARKCERCWRWELDVGTLDGHPDLCGRCAQAVAGL